MDDENGIRKFVRLQIHKGRDLPDILNDFCQSICGKSYNFAPFEFAQWLKNLRPSIDIRVPFFTWHGEVLKEPAIFEGPAAFKFKPITEDDSDRFVDPIPPVEFQLPLKITSNEFERAKRTYESRKCPGRGTVMGCRLIMLSERYAIDAESDPYKAPVFYLLDILHNEKRELQMKGEFSDDKMMFELAALDSTHFSYYAYDTEPPEAHDPFVSYLFQLDVAQLHCKVMDRHEFNGYYTETIVDSVDPHKFLLLYFDDEDNEYARKCRLNIGGKLEIDDERLDLNIEIPDKDVMLNSGSYKLEGDKFYGLCHDDDKYENFVFEATFERGRINFLQLIKIDIADEFTHGSRRFAWSANAFYVLKCIDYKKNYLYKFDMETQKLTKDECSLRDEARCVQISNGIIIVCTASILAPYHVWHRIALSSPDTLLNLSMEHLQREATFMDENEHAKFVKKLPPNLRPFGGNSEQ